MRVSTGIIAATLPVLFISPSLGEYVNKATYLRHLRENDDTNFDKGHLLRPYGFPDWTDPPNVYKRPFRQSTRPTTPAILSPTTTSSPCDDEVVVFESRTLVGLISRPSELSYQEIDVLEKAFADAYSAIDCGVRRMINVTMITSLVRDPTDLTSRALQGSTNSADRSYHYQSFTECKGRGPCKQNTSPTMRRAVRDLQNDDDCTCPPPTEGDFLLSFNNAIQDLVASGELVSVFGANDNFAELEKVECTGDPKPFETTVSVVFEGNGEGGDISDSELAALEAAFVDAYNEANVFNRKTCDSEHLVAANVKLTRFDNGRRLQGSGRYRYRGPLDGICRKCKDNPNPFSESQGRRSAFASYGHKGTFQYSSDHLTRLLQTVTDGCYCPRVDPEPRRATTEEFQGSYNKIIEYLREEGIVQTVTSVAEVNATEPPAKVTLYVDITSPGSSFTNQEFDFLIKVAAIGVGGAKYVVLTVGLPDEGSLVSSDPTGILFDNNTLTIDLGYLDEVDITIDDIVITWQSPNTETTLYAIATVTADNADTVSDEEQVVVEADIIDSCEDVVCPPGEACDVATGRCEPIEQVAPCVAIIDEWSGITSTKNPLWEDFRARYPKRPFCLLVPNSFFPSTTDSKLIP